MNAELRRGADAGVRVTAPAKVNLHFEVLGKRPDGYHEVRTVMQAVSLCDEMVFTTRPDGQVSLTCSDDDLPCGDENLVVRAADGLREHCGVGYGAAIHLEKRIPVGGGLGGGSSDGAAALLALNRLWGLRVPMSELEELAAALGSDVAFFLRGGTALCEGRGERVTPVPCGRRLHYVLVMPPCHVSTARVYAAVQCGLTERTSGSKNVLEALAAGDLRRLGCLLQNDLQTHAMELYGELKDVWRELAQVSESCGFEGVLLTGSGSTFFALVSSQDQAERAAYALQSKLAAPCAAVHSISPWG